MQFNLYDNILKTFLCKNKEGFVLERFQITLQMEYDSTKHFCGLGHQAYGMVESIDLKGKTVSLELRRWSSCRKNKTSSVNSTILSIQ